jgi:azurin
VPWGKVKASLLGLALLGALAAFGCSQGSYPVDIFYEMHYQQTHKAQEPPSLSAPASSVPWYPPPVSTSFTDGQHLYTVNCAMCHGDAAAGDGPVVQMLKEDYGYRPVIDPPDLTDNPVDNIVFTISSNTRVFGPDSVMPPFGKLLSEAERLAIAEYVDSLPLSAQAASAAAEPPAPVAEPAAPKSEPSAGAIAVSVKGDSLEFDTGLIEVEAGSEVALYLDNVSTLYEHNLVIVTQGEKDAVSERGAVAGPDGGWLQADDPDVIGGVELLGPGGAGEASLAAPEAGSYQFVCTFPGHNATMFGDFIVKP